MKCGKPMGSCAPETSRDLQYERQFLREAARVAENRYGTPAAGFGIAVGRRLKDGQEQFGDTYLTKDLAGEILEEAWDAGAYAVLEAQKRMSHDEDDAAAWHLFEIAVHAACIDHHSRALR